ncbi:MAG: chemotaxis protein CheB, partial [gamma proteobacterium symbiont of Ctena orbiculata]
MNDETITEPAFTEEAEGREGPTHIVGIGASAGGLEAIEAFFKAMPHDSGVAFVVIQHLSPDHKSLMAELLSKRTRMPVHRAEDGMIVEHNSVYLIPPNKNLRLFHGRIILSEQDRDARGINLPIDIFFRSLAEDQGAKAIAIVLSGTGSDGTSGIRAIKEELGMAMVQVEETAAFDGMPRSAIATGLVDYVLPPEEMPAQLLSYLKHPFTAKNEYASTMLTDEDGVTRIFALLRENNKIDF